jgi:hypothetical protein
MSILPAAPIRLDALRRSQWLAGFVLLVCLLRVGMAIACTPHDFAEMTSQGSGPEAAVHHVGDTNGDDEPGDDTSGHCLHCACHHAVAIPAFLTAPASDSADPAVALPMSARANAPPSHELRPPIG